MAKVAVLAVRCALVAIPADGYPDGWRVWASAGAIRDWRRNGLRPRIVAHWFMRDANGKTRRIPGGPRVEMRWFPLPNGAETLQWVGPVRSLDRTVTGEPRARIVRSWR